MKEFQVAMHFGAPRAIKLLQAWAECGDRVRITINVIHNREFDQDNLYSAAKIPLDALKALGCITDDNAKNIDLLVTQELAKQKVTQFWITRLKEE